MNNRPINFRVWHPQTSRFYYIHLDELVGVGDRVVNIPKNSVIQQYVGFNDKNDIAIYEGDIIKLEGSPYVYEVVWDKWRWGIDSKGIVTDFIQGFTSAVEDRAIVIGNIFENKELLK